jgi:hypothetical protein
MLSCPKGWLSLASKCIRVNRSYFLRDTLQHYGHAKPVGAYPRLTSSVSLGYWGQTRKGYWRLKYTSRRDRFASKLKSLRDFLWKNLNADRITTLRTVIRVVKGWINYHAISDNRRRVGQFIYQSRRTIHRWFNRQGGRHGMSWDKLARILKAVGFPEFWKTTSMFPAR